MRRLNTVFQFLCLLLVSAFAGNVSAQDAAPSKELALYNQIKAFDLNAGAVDGLFRVPRLHFRSAYQCGPGELNWIRSTGFCQRELRPREINRR